MVHLWWFVLCRPEERSQSYGTTLVPSCYCCRGSGVSDGVRCGGAGSPRASAAAPQLSRPLCGFRGSRREDRAAHSAESWEFPALREAPAMIPQTSSAQACPRLGRSTSATSPTKIEEAIFRRFQHACIKHCSQRDTAPGKSDESQTRRNAVSMANEGL